MKYRLKALPGTRRALQRARSIPLSVYMAQRAAGRATFIPSEMDMGITGDHVVYEEREPRITPTGILDHRGMMLLRVCVPIKEELGFIKPRMIQSAPDEVETILPEDLLAVSDCGLGLGWLPPEEVEDDDTLSPESLQAIIRAAIEKCGGDQAQATELLAGMGIEVEFSDPDDDAAE